jgi:Asp-tRNA(Asn)/Glu-tRNA(Gln) amidotransferase A subunit family amidase
LVNRLEQRGFEVKRIPVMADIEAVIARHGLITAAEAAINHAALYPQFTDSYHSRTRQLIEQGQTIDPDQLEKARNERLTLRDQLLAAMLTEGIDVWLSPSAPGAAPKGLESTGDPVMSLPWTHAGLPTLSIPAGINHAGLPLGLQAAGAWYADEQLIEYGALIHEAIR